MSADKPSLDPYRSPNLPEGPYAGQMSSARPGLLTALCVLAIVLGALGMLNAFIGSVAAAAGPRLQAMVQPRPMPGTPPEMQQVQQDFQDATNAIQAKYKVGIFASLLFRFAAGLLLLVGGIKAISLRESGRRRLLLAFGVATCFELANAILQSMVNLEMMTAANSVVDGFLQSASGEGIPGIRTAVKGVLIGSMVFAYLIVLAKVALYVGGIVYLQRPKVRELFVVPALTSGS
jgi:hypothetical protein